MTTISIPVPSGPTDTAVGSDLGYAPAVQTLIDLALAEDVGRGDLTTEATVTHEATATAARIASRQSPTSTRSVAKLGSAAPCSRAPAAVSARR